MVTSEFIALLHEFVGFLLWPVISGLILLAGLAIWECGKAFGERWRGLRYMADHCALHEIETIARKRIERTDILARVAPMLGLMGTLIPLGPGLAALGNGNITLLSEAVTIAFDTTVMGLFTGLIGFILGRLRRRWYDNLLDSLPSTPPGAEVKS